MDNAMQKNVQVYSVEPRGKGILVLADLRPMKSASGEVFVNRTDEVLRKGTALAVGPDVKNCKKGDRILYFFDKATEIESFFRMNYGYEKQCGKYMVFDDNVVAVIKNKTLEDYEPAGPTVKCLRAEDMDDVRKAAIEEVERKQSMMPSRSNILRPGRG